MCWEPECRKARVAARSRLAYATKVPARRATCAYCLQAFPVRRSRTRFCSREHSVMARKVGAARTVPYRSCVVCQGTFVRRTKRPTCSRDCDLVAGRRREAASGRSELRHWGGPKLVNFICRRCGKGCRPAYGDKRRVFCSDNCSHRFSSRTDKYRRNHHKLLRTMRTKLLQCNGPVCGICSLVIRLDVDWAHPLSLTLDHIVPLSAGGTHAESNLQLAHRRCNDEKGEALPDERWVAPPISRSFEVAP